MFELLRSNLLAVARPIHVRLRAQKLRLFEALTNNTVETSLLDVGGGLGIAGEFAPLYLSFSDVTVVNISRPATLADGRGNVRFVLADGCMMPFPSHSFDWVFSNAVIEHVGDRKKQESFAGEIRRVARKGYFVTTPNRYFPLEPHSFIPFYQFLSPRLQRRIVRFSPGYLREYEEIHLLSSGVLKRLFPEAEIVSLGFPVLGNSLIAYYSKGTPHARLGHSRQRT